MPKDAPYKVHLIDGGQLRYVANELGYTGYLCAVCSWWHPKNIKAKGGSPMPFPKDVKQAGEVAKELRGQLLGEFENQELLLRGYTFSESGQYGKLVLLECEDSEGSEVRISTFSEVVFNQLEIIKDSLPLIIIPRKVSNYYTIY